MTEPTVGEVITSQPTGEGQICANCSKTPEECQCKPEDKKYQRRGWTNDYNDDVDTAVALGVVLNDLTNPHPRYYHDNTGDVCWCCCCNSGDGCCDSAGGNAGDGCCYTSGSDGNTGDGCCCAGGDDGNAGDGCCDGDCDCGDGGCDCGDGCGDCDCDCDGCVIQ